MSTLSAIITCDTTQFNKSINKAKQTLEKYKNKTDQASQTIRDNVTVSDSQIASYNRVIRALEKVSSGTMTTTQQEKALTNQIKELKMQWANLSNEAKRSDFGKAMSESCRSAQAQLRQLRTQMNQVKDSMSGVSDLKSGASFLSLAKTGVGLATGIGTAAAAFDVLKDAVMGNIETARDFEKSVSNITALTGASADTIDKLKKSAIELGGSTTQTASEVIKSFGMIGSKSPDLLKDADALAEVTKNCIMLSEASNMDLSTAATAVTGILNQFGLSADHSAEIVNMLAAASQQGAGDVAYLNTAIVNCGSVAGTLGISANETVGVLEQLAQSGVDASSAGNQLKNIMLKLEASSDQNLKPSVVGLVQAIKNLGDEHLSTTELTKKFGTENVAAALTLIKTANNADKLTKSITGTNTAEKQQKINNDNLDGSLKNLQSKWEAFNLAINEGNGLIRSCIDVTASLVGWMTKLITKTDEATKARQNLNKELGGSGDKATTVTDNLKRVNGGKTTGQKIGEFNKIKHAYDKQINDYNKQIKMYDKQIATYLKNGNNKTGSTKWDNTLTALKAQREQLAKARRAIMKDQRDFIKGGVKSIYPKKTAPVPDPSTGGGGNGDTTTNTPKYHTTKVDPVVDPKSLKGIEEQISKKKEELSLAINPDDIKKIQKEINELTSKKNSIEFGTDSLKGIENEISNKKEELSLAVNQEDRKKIQKEINDLTEKKNVIEFDTNFKSGSYDDLIKSIDKVISAQDEFKTSAMGGNAIIDANNRKITDNNEEIKRLIQVLKQLQEQYDKLSETINSENKLGIDTSDEVEEYKKLGKAIDDVNDKINNLKGQNGKLVKSNTTVEKGINKTTKRLNKMHDEADGIGSIADAFGDVSSVTKGTTKAVLGATSALLSGTSQMIDQLAELSAATQASSAATVAAKEGEAIASATASVSKAPWPIILAMIATVVGTITSIFSSINTYADGGIIPKYATGGMISGATSIGDYNLARVNGGEMILNGSQQRKLFNILNSNGSITGNSNLAGKVEFKISGSELKGVLRNYDKKMSRIK